VLRGEVQVPLGGERLGGGLTILRLLLVGGLCGTAVLLVFVVVVVVVFFLGLVFIEVFVLSMVGLILSIALGILVFHVALVVETDLANFITLIVLVLDLIVLSVEV
jgi:hypothetical protein